MMMKDVYTPYRNIPKRIDEEMLQKAVEEQGPQEEFGEVARAEGIEFKHVKHLQLAYKNILKIDGLFELTNLTKLQLDNNIIEKIENLNHLVNLVWLDLSFNNIEAIGGLHSLTKLEDLTLYSNRITRIENLDSLVNLQVLSLGRNLLDDLHNIPYLRCLAKLESLNLTENPICELKEYPYYVAAFLPHLRYLDYKLMPQENCLKGYNMYPFAVEQVLDREAKDNYLREERKRQAEELAFHTKCFVPEMSAGELFDELYKNDPEGRLFLQLPGCEELVARFREKFQGVCTSIFLFGLETYKTRTADVKLFFQCIDELKTQNKEKSMKLLGDFRKERKIVFDEIEEIESFHEVVKTVREFNDKTTLLWDELMGLEMALVDQIDESLEKFELSLQEMVSYFLEYVQGEIVKLREIEGFHNEKLLILVNDMNDPILRGDVVVPVQLHELFSDKDNLLASVAASHDAHMLAIDTKEDWITHNSHKWKDDLVANIKEEELKRNRHRVTEICHFVDSQRFDLEDIELLNLID